MKDVYLLTVLELPHHSIIIPLGDSFGITHRALDERLQTPFQQLVHLVVIIIIVPDTEHALYVIPDGSAKTRGVHLVVRTHCVIS